MNNKEIKNILESQAVKFNIKGRDEFAMKDDGSWGYIPKLFQTFKIDDDKPVCSIMDKWGSSSMNVNKFGPTSFTVFTFDLMGNQTRARIHYKDITILK